MISFKMAIIYILKRHYLDLSSQAVLFLFLLVCFTVKKCAAATTKATTTVPTDAPTTTTITPTTTKAPLNGICSSDVNCLTGICSNSICKCNNTQYNNSGTCVNKIPFGSSCNGSYQCVNTTDCVGNEDSGVCGCNDTHFSKDNATCQEKLPFGTSCNKSDQCKNTTDCINQSGDSMVCGCSGDDFSYDNFTCLPKLFHLAQCNGTGQCKYNTECLGNKCGCNSSHYFNDSICLPKSDHQGPCSLNMTDVCSNNATKCISQSGNYYCLCDASSFWYNSSKTCLKTSELKVKIVKFSTTDHSVNIEWSPVQYGNVYYNITSSPQSSSLQNLTSNNITIANLTGGTSYTFTITTVLPGDQFYQDRSDINTVSITTKAEYGSNCSQTSECAEGFTCTPDRNKVHRCLCDTSEYYTNKGTCSTIKIVELKLEEQIRGMNNISLKWTDNNLNNDNITYLIKIGNNKTRADKNGGVITNLAPGTRYDIAIIKRVPEDSDYEEKMSNESTIVLWTKPARPGSISINRLNSTDSYNISFQPSESGNTSYTVTLKHDSYMQSITVTTTNVIFDNLTSAVTYQCTIIAANGFGDTEIRTELTRTDESASGVVSGLSITNITAKSALVQWRRPENPNGNITAYLIVLKTTDSKCLAAYLVNCSKCTINRNVSVPDGCPSIWVYKTEPLDNLNSLHYSNTLNLNDLDPYKSYTVTVFAINQAADGMDTSAEFTTSTAAALPVSGIVLNSTKVSDRVDLHVTWVPSNFTGLTNFTICLQRIITLKKPNEYTFVECQVVTGYNINDCYFNNLLGFWNYSVNVTASTEAGSSSPSQTMNVTTATKVPGKPKFKIYKDNIKARNITITIDCPDEQERNGIIGRFIIEKTDEMGKKENQSSQGNINCDNSTIIHLSNITVEKTYSIQVLSANQAYEGNFSEPENLTVDPRLPLPEVMNKSIKKDASFDTTETKIGVTVCTQCLQNSEQGKVIKTGLLVCVGISGSKCFSQTRKKRSLNEISNSTWYEAKVEGFTIEYKTTVDDWLTSQNDEFLYIIGQDDNCKTGKREFCNGPLLPDKKIRVTAFTCNAAGCEMYTELSFQTRDKNDYKRKSVTGKVSIFHYGTCYDCHYTSPQAQGAVNERRKTPERKEKNS